MLCSLEHVSESYYILHDLGEMLLISHGVLSEKYSARKYFLLSIPLICRTQTQTVETGPEDSRPIIELLRMPSRLLACKGG